MVGILGGVVSKTMTPERSPFRIERIDVAVVAAVVVLALASLWVWSIARGRVVAPLDRVVIERVCLGYADEIEREFVASERVPTSGILTRHEGFCQYGVGPNAEAPVTLPLSEIETGSGYNAFRWIGLIIELGIVSLFLRMTVEPTIEAARWVQDRVLRASG
jgi:hypothetical protein